MRGALPAVTDGSGETITSERKRERGLTTSVLLQFKDTLVTPRPVEAQSSEGGRPRMRMRTPTSRPLLRS